MQILSPDVLKDQARKMVKENILPFWQNMIDREHGGFYGEADFYGNINKTADKGGVLNSRILWTFSAAYRLFKDEAYKTYADHAFDFLKKAFYDNEHGGVYWLVDYKGNLLQSRKQFYNIAFAIYALSEYYFAFDSDSSRGTSQALEIALKLFEALETHGRDLKSGGYIEARVRDWKDIDDFRLSGKDLNSPKSMNTNLHVLEAYTTLTRAVFDSIKNNESDKAHNSTGEPAGKKPLADLLRITLDKIVSHDYHFKLFFDMDWNSLSNDVSYGHDIEGSWLMYEAALAVGDENLINEVKKTAVSIADVIYAKALDYREGKLENGGFLSGVNEEGKILTKKEWWPQAEAVVGFHNAYELSGEQKYFDAAAGIWEYINKYFLDKTCGEWHNELFADNTQDAKMPKAGFWKCPYHNARACFELIKRIN